jgi:hypothetical protein
MNSDIIKSDGRVVKNAAWNETSAPEWFFRMNWTEYEKLAAIGYRPEQIAMYYDIPKLEFMYYFMLVDSKLKYHYDRGQLYCQAKEGMDMMEDAATSATQARRLDKMRRSLDYRNAKQQLIYEGL